MMTDSSIALQEIEDNALRNAQIMAPKEDFGGLNGNLSPVDHG